MGCTEKPMTEPIPVTVLVPAATMKHISQAAQDRGMEVDDLIVLGAYRFSVGCPASCASGKCIK